MNARKFHWEVQDIWVGAKTPKIFRAEIWSKASESPLQGLTCVDLLKSNGTRSKSEQLAFNWANHGLETVSLWQRTHNALFKQNSNYRRAEPLARLEAIFDATTLPQKWSRHNGPLSQSLEIFSFAISTTLGWRFLPRRSDTSVWWRNSSDCRWWPTNNKTFRNAILTLSHLLRLLSGRKLVCCASIRLTVFTIKKLQ